MHGDGHTRVGAGHFLAGEVGVFRQATHDGFFGAEVEDFYRRFTQDGILQVKELVLVYQKVAVYPKSIGFSIFILSIFY